MVYGSFDMDWLQNTLGIRPIFSCDEIYWTKEVNQIMAEETENNVMDLSLLVLEGLERHFTGDWGGVSEIQKNVNNQILQNHYKGISSGPIISTYTDTNHSLLFTTSAEFDTTIISLQEEKPSSEVYTQHESSF